MTEAPTVRRIRTIGGLHDGQCWTIEDVPWLGTDDDTDRVYVLSDYVPTGQTDDEGREVWQSNGD